jgi:hypothetical protein
VGSVHPQARDVLTNEVEGDETCHVQGSISMGLLAGRPRFSPSDGPTFDGMAVKLKLAH